MFFLMKWREKWSEKCSEISSRAGGFPRPLFFIRALPCGGYHVGAHRAIALAGGVPQTPFSSGRRPVFFSKRTKRVCPFLRREEKN